MLTVYSASRDRAIGLPRHGQRTLNLIDYQAKRNITSAMSMVNVAFLKAIIDECRSDVEQLLKVADTPDKRREILPKVQELNDLASMAARELGRITDGI